MCGRERDRQTERRERVARGWHCQPSAIAAPWRDSSTCGGAVSAVADHPSEQRTDGRAEAALELAAHDGRALELLDALGGDGDAAADREPLRADDLERHARGHARADDAWKGDRQTAILEHSALGSCANGGDR